MEHGISEDQVRSYLYTTCKLLPQEVSKARVLKQKTFISIPENRLDSCLEEMRAHPIIKKKVKIYLVEDHFRPQSRDKSSGRRDHGRDRFIKDKKRPRRR